MLNIINFPFLNSYFDFNLIFRIKMSLFLAEKLAKKVFFAELIVVT